MKGPGEEIAPGRLPKRQGTGTGSVVIQTAPPFHAGALSLAEHPLPLLGEQCSGATVTPCAQGQWPECVSRQRLALGQGGGGTRAS